MFNLDFLCNDGDPCTTLDSCQEVGCVGNGLICDDDNECTVDSCDNKMGECSHFNMVILCDNGNVCITNDVCADGICKVGDVINCDDNNVCTVDICDLEIGCVNMVSLGFLCNDGDVCIGLDNC